VHGRPERIKLDSFGTITVQQARELAQAVNVQVAQGLSPTSARQEIRGELTLGELFEIYLERHAKVHKRTWADDERRFKYHMSSLKRRRLSELQRNEILDWHAKIGKVRGIYAANHALAILRILFSKAIEWEFFEGTNPCIGVKKFRETSRDRFIQPDEMQKFFDALERLSETTTRDFFLMCLYTGARKSNVLSMRWDEINLARSEWRIPMTKNGTSQVLPLVDTAILLLKERRSIATGEWVFPSKLNASGHLIEPKGSWETIRKTTGLEDLRMHDLRRSLGSWQARTGASLVIIGKTLNHQSPQSTQVYARLDSDPVRQAMETAVTAMKQASTNKKSCV
jgi:integrase